jgi:D-proline reductase (dithiol) PrdB
MTDLGLLQEALYIKKIISPCMSIGRGIRIGGMNPRLLRLKHRLISRAAGIFPSLQQRLVNSYKPIEMDTGSLDTGRHDTDVPTGIPVGIPTGIPAAIHAGIPWSAVKKPLKECRVMLVTTAGVHHRRQPPFDMSDPMGDPTLRIIDLDAPADDLTITHDYYDHSDADKDLNVVFPLQRLKEFLREGIIGGLTDFHLSFMGHIDGPHIKTLMEKTATEAARLALEAGADCVILTPG